MFELLASILRTCRASARLKWLRKKWFFVNVFSSMLDISLINSLHVEVLINNFDN